MTTNGSTFIRALRGAAPLANALSWPVKHMARDRALSHLERMDDRMLRDVGLSRFDLERFRQKW